MARNNYTYTNYTIQVLKDKIQDKAGFKVFSMRDCKALSGKLEAQGLHISPHTIGRFFQVIKNKNMPSQFTLDQLADYVGYDHYRKFHDNISKAQLTDPGQITEDATVNIDSELSLIRFCLQDGAYTPLINYLRTNRQILENDSNPKMHAILRTISKSIEEQYKNRRNIYELLMQEVPWAQAYFKHLIQADFISGFYGKAVEEQFYRIIHPSNSEYHSQVIWRYTMVAFKAFYNGQKKKFLENSYELFRLSPPQENTLAHHTYGKEVQVWVFARYHFVHFLYLYYSGHLKPQTLEQKLLFMEKELLKTQTHDIAVTLSFLFEALWVTGYSKHILQFSDNYFKVLGNLSSILSKAGENLKTLIAMMVFFQQATESVQQSVDSKPLIQHLQAIKKAYESIEYKPFGHTYQVYLNELYALLTIDQKEKEAFFQKARQHANIMKNKYFMKQIDRIKRENF